MASSLQCLLCQQGDLNSSSKNVFLKMGMMPYLPMAGGRAGMGVMTVGETALSLTSCNTRESEV